jgi:hypothetical protein
MDTDTKLVLLLMAAMLSGGVGLGWMVGCHNGANTVRREAVKAGVAEYRADAEGNVSFHWKPTTQPVER